MEQRFSHVWGFVAWLDRKSQMCWMFDVRLCWWRWRKYPQVCSTRAALRQTQTTPALWTSCHDLTSNLNVALIWQKEEEKLNPWSLTLTHTHYSVPAVAGRPTSPGLRIIRGSCLGIGWSGWTPPSSITFLFLIPACISRLQTESFSAGGGDQSSKTDTIKADVGKADSALITSRKATCDSYKSVRFAWLLSSVRTERTGDASCLIVPQAFAPGHAPWTGRVRLYRFITVTSVQSSLWDRHKVPEKMHPILNNDPSHRYISAGQKQFKRLLVASIDGQCEPSYPVFPLDGIGSHAWLLFQSSADFGHDVQHAHHVASLRKGDKRSEGSGWG